jgi:hypothetical protein
MLFPKQNFTPITYCRYDTKQNAVKGLNQITVPCFVATSQRWSKGRAANDEDEYSPLLIIFLGTTRSNASASFSFSIQANNSERCKSKSRFNIDNTSSSRQSSLRWYKPSLGTIYAAKSQSSESRVLYIICQLLKKVHNCAH